MSLIELNHQSVKHQYLVKQSIVNDCLNDTSPLVWIWGDMGMGKSVLMSHMYIQCSSEKYWLDISDDSVTSDAIYLQLKDLLNVENVTSNNDDKVSYIHKKNLSLQQQLVAQINNSSDMSYLFIDSVEKNTQSVCDVICSLVPDCQDHLRIIVASRDHYGLDYFDILKQQLIYEIPQHALYFSTNETVSLYLANNKEINERFFSTYNMNLGIPVFIAKELFSDTPEQVITFQNFLSNWFDLIDAVTLNDLIKLSLYEEVDAHLMNELGIHVDSFQKSIEPLPYIAFKQHNQTYILSLHAQLQTALIAKQNELSKDILLKAANYEQNLGHIPQALLLQLKGGEHEQAHHLFLQYVDQFYIQGQFEVISQFLDRFPKDEIAEFPWLIIWQSIINMPVDIQRAKTKAELAYRLFKKQNDIRGMYRSLGQIILTYFVTLDDYSDIKKWIDELTTFDNEVNYQSNKTVNDRAQIVYPIWFGMFMTYPEHPSLSIWKKRTKQALLGDAQVILKLKILLIIQKAYLYSGDNYKVHPLETMVQVGNEKPMGPYDTLSYNLVKIHEHWSAGEFELIETLYEQSEHIAEQSGMFSVLNHLSLQVVNARLLNNDFDKSKQEIYRLLETIPRHQNVLLSLLYSLETWRQVLQGDAVRALSTSEQGISISKKSGSFAYLGFAYLAEIYALFLAQEFDQAYKKLTTLKNNVQTQYYPIIGFHIDLLLCYAANQQGDDDKAKQLAKNAMVFASNKKLFHFNWAVPDVLSVAVSLSLEQQCEVIYCNELIQQRKLNPPHNAISFESWHWPVSMTTLGGFECSQTELTKQGKSRRLQLMLIYLVIIVEKKGIALANLFHHLWPNEDITEVRHKLDNTLYRLRKILGKESLLIVNDKLILNHERVWVDVHYLQNLIKSCEKAVRTNHYDEMIKTIKTINKMYTDSFLSNVNETPIEINNYQVFIENEVNSIIKKVIDKLKQRSERKDVLLIQTLENRLLREAGLQEVVS